jgi:hypothetical protein
MEISETANMASKLRHLFIAAAIIIIVGGASFFYYLQSSSEIRSLRQTIIAQQSQISTLQNQTSSLKSQISSLQKIVGLNNSITEVTATSFVTGPDGRIQVASFVAKYAGYVVITETTASDPANEGPEVEIIFTSATNTHSSYDAICLPYCGYFYAFSSSNVTMPVPSSNSIAIPVTPGTITIYLDTSDTTSQYATLSVIYYY